MIISALISWYIVDSHLIKLIFEVLAMLLQLEHLHLLLPLAPRLAAAHRAGRGEGGEGGRACRRRPSSAEKPFSLWLTLHLLARRRVHRDGQPGCINFTTGDRNHSDVFSAGLLLHPENLFLFCVLGKSNFGSFSVMRYETQSTYFHLL